MTFSICVRESDTEGGPQRAAGGPLDEEGTERYRFGVAVTTRLPGVGTLCPFASENGAVATQSLVNVDLGRRGIEYIDDGLAVEDSLRALLNADDGAESRQLHGVDCEGTFAFSGEESEGWFGHREGENYTVAGNLLTGESVTEAVAETYESQRGEDRPLAERLIDALAAGQEEGGDRREELPIQSAALKVASSEEHAMTRFYNDLRVDATETPITDLRETYDLARAGYEDAAAEYEEAFEEDAMEEAG